MTTWADFELQAPDLAAAGRRLLAEVAFLATAGSTGRPRVHPFCPAIAEGRLWGFIIEESPKRADLDSNGYFAIHALPGFEDEQFYVAGTACRIHDPQLRDAVLAAMPYDDADERHLLYEFRLERALWTTWENFQTPGMRPVHHTWPPRTRASRGS
jgi:hypothetical protein